MSQRTEPWTQRVLENDNKFIASRRPTGVADDGSASVVLENTGEHPLFIEEMVFKNNQGKAEIDVTKNLNVDANGTSIDVISSRVNGVTGGNDFGFEFGGSYSGGTSFSLDLITGTTSPGGGVARIATQTAASAFMVDPGQAIRSGNSSDMLFSLVCYQPPE